MTDDYMENVYEQFFFLKYAGSWSILEAYNLPIGLRQWFVERLLKQLEAENEAIERASKGQGGKAQTLSVHNQPPPPQQFSRKYGQS